LPSPSGDRLNDCRRVVGGEILQPVVGQDLRRRLARRSDEDLALHAGAAAGEETEVQRAESRSGVIDLRFENQRRAARLAGYEAQAELDTRQKGDKSNFRRRESEIGLIPLQTSGGRAERPPGEPKRSLLPEAVRPVVSFAYVTGWRVNGEILPLQWCQVDTS
jgi:hypothetical protein